jgi:transposase InsO family protein
MANTIQEERLRWVLPIYERRLSINTVMETFPYGKRTLERWLSLYKERGESALIPLSTRPKTQPRETPINIKEKVIALRKKDGLCALKLHWRLAKSDIYINTRVIGKILKQEGLVRKYRIKKLKIKYIKVPLLPGELVEIDVKYVPDDIEGKPYFQYTAIDCASRWRFLKVYDAQSSYNSIRFLKEVQKAFGYRIRAIKTDNGAIFTNYYTGTNKRSDVSIKTIHALDMYCRDEGIIHYLIDPGKPAQNGKVERSHREDQEKFYEKNEFKTYPELQKEIRKWNKCYNNLEHCGLNGKSPNEYLADYAKGNPPNVCS